jgi:hypothetical protein
MITVDVKKLIEAVEEANEFHFPYMSEGSEYLYDNLYNRLTRGENVRLSEIDFGSFELDDVDAIREMHSDVFEANERKAHTLASSLQRLAPATVAAVFV